MKVDWVKLATILGGLATFLGLVWGINTFYQSTQAQAEVAAINLLREHWTLANDHPLLSSELPNHKALRVNENGTFDRTYVRLATHALFTVESVYKLVGGAPKWHERWVLIGEAEEKLEERKRSWNATALDLARRHDTFVLSYDFPCDQYAQQFIEFLRESSVRFRTICPTKTETDWAAIENLSNAAKAQQDFYLTEGRQARYTKEIADLSEHGFEQGHPSVKIRFVLDETTTREAYYCMDASGKAYEHFRMTPYEDKPIPGSCGGH